MEMLSNYLEIYKDRDSRMSKYAGDPCRILFMQSCGNADYKRSSYTVERINSMFESGDTYPENLLEKIVTCLQCLQAFSHGDPQSITYKFAAIEYPVRYAALLEGLSQEALEIIKSINISKCTSALPANLGRQFYQQFIKDKQEGWQANTAP